MDYTKDKVNVFRQVDWITVLLYLVMVSLGWLCIYGASYDFTEIDIWGFDTRVGKQLVWMGCAFMLALVSLSLDKGLFFNLSAIMYVGMIVLLIVTRFVANDIKGSYSWITLGSVSVQPAEFAKFFTALTIARYADSYEFSMQNHKKVLMAFLMILLPMGLIVLQHETGSALVFLAFLIPLYREGLPGVFLLAGVCAIAYFIISVRFGETVMADGVTIVGQYAVLMLIILLMCLQLIHCRGFRQEEKWVVSLGAGVSVSLTLLSLYSMSFDLALALSIVCVCLIIALLAMGIRQGISSYMRIAFFALGSLMFLHSVDYVFNRVLEPYQQVRIKVALGMESDVAGAGYNVNQSIIAIGSGGLWGKGFLNGTQTKLKYVPEQDTDFIFCTMGEEQGFLGSAMVIVLFVVLILRLLVLAERQHTRFGRVYGYSVASILFSHVLINIGMVLGLVPVIGIPLPFFSYGGSSLWGFTLLLFVFLRIDAQNQLDKR
ncbi:MAG: rod shape-determining protein RodA [Bacteroidales bacterium]|nr:rod shape-determining protein RodA [Bacteroidales bacterium]